MAGVQDTGNPVLDSMVNLIVASNYNPEAEALKALHNVLLELAQKEPGGLRARGHEGALNLVEKWKGSASD